MLLVIDNHDSFTYNLVQYFKILNVKVLVYKNDEITLTQIKKLNPSYLVISPGPKGPDDANISLAAIKFFYNKIPLLGVCLGHQCLAQAFGGQIIQSREILHGKTSQIFHTNSSIFYNIPNGFHATRYHSLIINAQTLPTCFNIIATTKDNLIMAIKHKDYPAFGVQFHPESILTEHGINILKNFLSLKITCYT